MGEGTNSREAEGGLSVNLRTKEGVQKTTLNALSAVGTTDTFLRDTERLTVHISQFKVNSKNSRCIEKMMSEYYESSQLT